MIASAATFAPATVPSPRKQAMTAAAAPPVARPSPTQPVAHRRVAATDALRQKLPSIGACIGGATPIDALRVLLAQAGFDHIVIAPNESSRAFIKAWTDDATSGEFVVSALITAYKPAA